MVEWNEDENENNDLIASCSIHFVPRSGFLIVNVSVLSPCVGSKIFEKLYVIRVLARIRACIREVLRPILVLHWAWGVNKRCIMRVT